MADNKSVAVFLLLLAVLFLLVAPLVMVFGHYSGFLSLPEFVTYHNISIAALAGLFVIPVLFIYAAAIIVAMKKRRPAGIALRPAVSKAVVVGKHVHYHWEDAFGPERERVAEKPHRSQISGKPFAVNYKALAAVAVMLAIIGLIVLISVVSNNTFFGGHNETKAVNITKAASDAVIKNASQLPQANASAGVPLLDKAKSFGSGVKARISAVNHVVWRNMAVAGVVILLAASLFYSRRTGQLAEVPDWLGGWAGWLLGIFAYARRNKLKVLLYVLAAAVVCGVIAAVAFGKLLKIKLPALPPLSNSAVNALVAARDFFAVYRLYIFIGFFACIVAISILFFLEKRNRDDN